MVRGRKGEENQDGPYLSVEGKITWFVGLLKSEILQAETITVDITHTYIGPSASPSSPSYTCNSRGWLSRLHCHGGPH